MSRGSTVRDGENSVYLNKSIVLACRLLYGKAKCRGCVALLVLVEGQHGQRGRGGERQCPCKVPSCGQILLQ